MTEYLLTICSPTDWPESWKDLQKMDRLLRCSICGEFFKNTTFIPACSHNYCSLCLRRYLNVKSKCPICEVDVQDSHLENNRIIDEIIQCFMNIRSELLEVLRKNCKNDDNNNKDNNQSELKGKSIKRGGNQSRFNAKKNKLTPSHHSKASQKRHRKGSVASDISSSSNDRWSPSDRKKLKRSTLRDESSDSDEILITEDRTPLKSPRENTSLSNGFGDKSIESVDCPVCGQKIPEKRINVHLDTCLSSKDRKDNLRRSSQSPSRQDQKSSETSSYVGANSFIPQVARRKPLNKLVYRLLSHSELKRKMKEHGLSIKGDRQTLVKRHQEFTTMYNSECSKPKPKSVAEIVRLVENGEMKKSKSVENRDRLTFERDHTEEDIEKIKSEYISQNQSQFTRLIEEVKSRKKKGENMLEARSSKAGCSKAESTPSTSKEKGTPKVLCVEEDTASNSSTADFEPAPKRSSSARRQLIRPSTQKRRTRSSVKIPEEIVEDPGDLTDDTVGDAEGDNASDGLADPIESRTSSAILPDPPSAFVLEDFKENDCDSNAESSESESMLPPAFAMSKASENEFHEFVCQEDDGDKSDEIEF